MLLDTPDVDSDAQVNWQRADIVRQASDVLVAVVTQQKYNDAAVKKFFRHAAAADKAIVLLFNQVDLTLDRDVWPQWLDVFCQETGAKPVFACVVPYDRAGAVARGLKFYSIGVDGRSFVEKPIDLRRELSELRYDELKSRALRARCGKSWEATPESNRIFGRFARRRGDSRRLGKRSSKHIGSPRLGPGCRRASSSPRFSGGGTSGAAHGRSGFTASTVRRGRRC